LHCGKGFFVHRIGVGVDRGEIAILHGAREFGGHVATRIFEQRNQVIAAVSGERVLEVDHAHTGKTLPRRKPEQVLRVVIAMHEDTVGRANFLKRLAPQRPMLRHLVRRGRASERKRNEPLGHQIHFGEFGMEVVIVERYLTHEQMWCRLGMKAGDGIRGDAVHCSLIAAIIEHLGEKIVAKILEQHEPLRHIGRIDFRRGKSAAAQIIGRGDKAFAICAGKPRHGIVAERLSLPGRGGGRAGRRFHLLRLIHQHRAPITPQHSIIAACRSIAAQGDKLCVLPACVLEEGARFRASVMSHHAAFSIPRRQVQRSGPEIFMRRSFSPAISISIHKAFSGMRAAARSGHSISTAPSLSASSIPSSTSSAQLLMR
jgi:hypothetical protein